MTLRLKLTLVLAYVLALESISAQAPFRRLPNPINHPSINVSAPFINLDGDVLLYISDDTEGNRPMIFASSRTDGVNWNACKVLPRTINNGLSFLKGYTLAPNGSSIYLAIKRSNGLGGFDIYRSDRRGAVWGEPVNVGLPFNSKGHDASPTFSADGTAAYFMRCDEMTFDQAKGCKIFSIRKKPNGQWNEAEELPAYINTGNSQTPRIMGDGETLIFASDKIVPGAGGMDLYETRWDGTAWSHPLPLTFLNTAEDDQFVSATSLGRYLMKDSRGTRTTEIVEVLFPAELKPKATLMVEGTVNTSASFVSVTDLQTRRKVFEGRPKSNEFLVYINEGSIYELAVDPEQDDMTFYTQIFDLTTEKIQQREKVAASVQQLSRGAEIILPPVFNGADAELPAAAMPTLKRVARLIKANPDFRFLMQITAPTQPASQFKEESVIDSTATFAPQTDSSASTPEVAAGEMSSTQLLGDSILNYMESLGVSRNVVSVRIVDDQEADALAVKLIAN